MSQFDFDFDLLEVVCSALLWSLRQGDSSRAVDIGLVAALCQFFLAKPLHSNSFSILTEYATLHQPHFLYIASKRIFSAAPLGGFYYGWRLCPWTGGVYFTAPPINIPVPCQQDGPTWSIHRLILQSPNREQRHSFSFFSFFIHSRACCIAIIQLHQN